MPGVMDDGWSQLAVTILPSGHLALSEAGERVPCVGAARLRRAAEAGQGELLLQLAADELQTSLPVDFGYLREYGAGVSDGGLP